MHEHSDGHHRGNSKDAQFKLSRQQNTDVTEKQTRTFIGEGNSFLHPSKTVINAETGVSDTN